MANGDKAHSKEGIPVQPAADEQPFDRWLRKQLHAMFDEVVNEPLPEDLLQIIDRDADLARQEADGNSPVVAPSEKP